MVEPARHRKEKKQEEIRACIFKATVDLVNRFSYKDVTVRMICDEAGISIGMFYRTFGAKSEIIPYFYDEAVRSYEATVRSSLKDLPPKERLISFYIWVIDFTAGFGLDFVKHFFNTNWKAQKPDHIDNQVVLLGTQLLEEISASGAVTLTKEPMQATHDILVVLKGILFDWCISEDKYDISAYARGILERIIWDLL